MAGRGVGNDFQNGQRMRAPLAAQHRHIAIIESRLAANAGADNAGGASACFFVKRNARLRNRFFRSQNGKLRKPVGAHQGNAKALDALFQSVDRRNRQCQRVFIGSGEFAPNDSRTPGGKTAPEIRNRCAKGRDGAHSGDDNITRH